MSNINKVIKDQDPSQVVNLLRLSIKCMLLSVPLLDEHEIETLPYNVLNLIDLMDSVE